MVKAFYPVLFIMKTLYQCHFQLMFIHVMEPYKKTNLKSNHKQNDYILAKIQKLQYLRQIFFQILLQRKINYTNNLSSAMLCFHHS